MAKSLDALQRELASIRTGRASPALIEHVKVDAYESQVPINQVASLSAPEPHMILVQPWDRHLIAAIERALALAETRYCGASAMLGKAAHITHRLTLVED